MKSKAIFLLVIFLLNSLVGFACAIGLEVNDDDLGGHQHKAKPISGVNPSKEDHCCETLVNDQITHSKAIQECNKVQVLLPVIWLSDYLYHLLIPAMEVKQVSNNHVDQRSRPPNADIRIVIQSFQI